MGLAARWAAQDRYALRTLPGPLSPITFPSTLLRTKAWIALGADPTADPADWAWEEISTKVRYQSGVRIAKGRPDESSLVRPSSAHLMLDNRDGRFSRRNPTGPYYGLLSRNTPIRLAVDPGDGDHIRFEGFVNEWPTRWQDESMNDSFVPIVCGGVLRRLQQTEVTKSALRRTIPAAGTVGTYWPLEDQAGSTSAAGAILDTLPMTVVSGTVTFGADSDVAGSLPLPDVSLGMLSGQVRNVGSDEWYCEFLVRTAFLGGAVARIYTNAADFTTIDIFPPSAAGDAVEYVVTDDVGGVTTTVTGDAVAAAWENEWHLITLVFSQDGTDVTCLLYVDGAFEGGDVPTAILGKPTEFVPNYQFGSFAADSFGHIAFGEGADATSAENAMDGYAGEKAHVRIVRLCEEEGEVCITLAADSEPMGPQPAGGLVSLLRECEAADLGVLHENGFRLGYQSRLERYDQTVGLALDFDLGQIAEEPEPADDDQRYRNRWTVGRSGGSEATFEDLTLVALDGPAADETTINVAADTQLLNQASWRVHRDTVDEDRWPSLSIALHNSPELITAWTSLGYGARVTAANPPDEVAPDTIDAVIEGHTEQWNQFLWQADLNTSPGSTYMVGVWGEATGGEAFYDTAGSELTAAFVTGTDTSMTVATTLGPIWTTTAANFPFDIECGGVVLTVTNITGASSPQTFTITQTPVNGVVKTLPIGEALQLANPTIWGL